MAHDGGRRERVLSLGAGSGLRVSGTGAQPTNSHAPLALPMAGAKDDEEPGSSGAAPGSTRSPVADVAKFGWAGGYAGGDGGVCASNSGRGDENIMAENCYARKQLSCSLGNLCSLDCRFPHSLVAEPARRRSEATRRLSSGRFDVNADEGTGWTIRVRRLKLASPASLSATLFHS